MGSREGGFTLLEAIVAMVIFASIVVAVQSTLGRGTRAVRFTDREADALQLARSILKSAGLVAPIQDKQHETGERDGLNWQMDVSKYSAPQSSDRPAKVEGYWIEVKVNWRYGRTTPGQLDLKTLKLSSAPPP